MKEHYAVFNDKCADGPEGRRDVVGCRPEWLAGARVEADQGVHVVVDDAPLQGRERVGHHARAFLSPELFAGLYIHGHERVVERPFADAGGGGHRAFFCELGNEDAVRQDELIRAFRAGQGLCQHFARGGIQDRDGRLEKAQGGVDAISLRHHAAGDGVVDLPAVACPRAELGLPVLHGNLPEQGAVERVARDEGAALGQFLVDAGGRLVENSEDASARRHDGVDAARELVASRPARARDPPQTPGWPDTAVVGDGVSAGVVEKVRPLVNVVGNWLAIDKPVAFRLSAKG